MSGLQNNMMERSMVEHRSTIRILLDAIGDQRMVEATYNGSTLVLAPHQLFVRHQSMYLSAYNPAKKRRSDEAPAIGHFNVTGLSNVVMTDERFDAIEGYTGTPPSGDDRPIACIMAD